MAEEVGLDEEDISRSEDVHEDAALLVAEANALVVSQNDVLPITHLRYPPEPPPSL